MDYLHVTGISLRDQHCRLRSRNCRARSDCTNVQADLAIRFLQNTELASDGRIRDRTIKEYNYST